MTNIAKDGQITARETDGARTFQFQMTDPALLRGLRVGSPVYANFDTKQVSLDGKRACCKIVNISTVAKPPAPGTTPAAPGGSATTQALPRPLKALRVSALEGPIIYGGNRVVGTVELNQPPGPNGVTVALESSDSQLAGVPPHVTVTGGVTSAETGPMYTARFDIATRPVQTSTWVIIRARAGVQTLEANLRIQRPGMKSAYMDPPTYCNGNKKGTVTYYLTGPAPSGLYVVVNGEVTRPTGSSGDTGGGSFTASETVAKGNSAGSMRIKIPRCHPPSTSWPCKINGVAFVGNCNTSCSASFVSVCGHFPD